MSYSDGQCKNVVIGNYSDSPAWPIPRVPYSDGKKIWNLFHLQPMRDQKGEVQYFIGVQLDGSQHVEPLHDCIPETTVKESSKLVKETVENVDEALRELPNANSKPEDLWKNHSKVVHPKPHRKDSSSWRAIQKILNSGEQLSLKHFKPVKPLGSGDIVSVHLVELCDSGEYFAMKAMDKGVMLNRNKPAPRDVPLQCLIKRNERNGTFYLSLALTLCKSI